MSIDLLSAIISLVVGAVAAVFTWTLSFIFRRSTDRAEASYRELMIGVLQDSGSVESGEGIPPGPRTNDDSLPVDSTAHPACSRVDDTPARLAALPIDYHAQVLAQSKQSFLLSLTAAIGGFVVIALGVVLAFVGTVPTTVATMAGGVVAEGVAALFFTQSNRARSLMAGQLEGFRDLEEVIRQASERLTLIEMVSDEKARDKLISETVLALVAERKVATRRADSATSGASRRTEEQAEAASQL